MPSPSKSRKASRRANSGKRAELTAWVLLYLKGYRILYRNFRSPLGEVDIIAFKRNQIIAVEVKSRRNMEDARHSIKSHQWSRIERGIMDFMMRHEKYQHCDIRFDAVMVAPKRMPLHIINAR